MVVTCVAYNCNNKKIKDDKSVNFYPFPFKNPEILREWVRRINQENWEPTRHSRLCSKHFTKESFAVRYGSDVPFLKEGAIPTIIDYSADDETSMPKSKTKRPQTARKSITHQSKLCIIHLRKSEIVGNPEEKNDSISTLLEAAEDIENQSKKFKSSEPNMEENIKPPLRKSRRLNNQPPQNFVLQKQTEKKSSGLLTVSVCLVPEAKKSKKAQKIEQSPNKTNVKSALEALESKEGLSVTPLDVENSENGDFDSITANESETRINEKIEMNSTKKPVSLNSVLEALKSKTELNIIPLNNNNNNNNNNNSKSMENSLDVESRKDISENRNSTSSQLNAEKASVHGDIQTKLEKTDCVIFPVGNSPKNRKAGSLRELKQLKSNSSGISIFKIPLENSAVKKTFSTKTNPHYCTIMLRKRASSQKFVKILELRTSTPKSANNLKIVSQKRNHISPVKTIDELIEKYPKLRNISVDYASKSPAQKKSKTSEKKNIVFLEHSKSGNSTQSFDAPGGSSQKNIKKVHFNSTEVTHSKKVVIMLPPNPNSNKKPVENIAVPENAGNLLSTATNTNKPTSGLNSEVPYVTKIAVRDIVSKIKVCDPQNCLFAAKKVAQDTKIKALQAKLKRKNERIAKLLERLKEKGISPRTRKTSAKPRKMAKNDSLSYGTVEVSVPESETVHQTTPNNQIEGNSINTYDTLNYPNFTSYTPP